MLRIAIPSNSGSNINFSTFEQYELPAPPDGVDAEINNDLILKFEDEEEAITYADQLENLSAGLKDKNTPQYIAISDIITAIRNDEFIQSYSR
ncbi:MAG: hypothetical protein JWQ84_3207 [Mucilaginibacter sp.]|jgi:hypothetical protein|nr:hypothetical protein [Mucilaginibacter sp.]MDB5018375.1 hypothetical protein [Mucilaginibacter sp.]MDB5139644.1 hypothetical protein [Mucilaginibacter sp.]